MLVSRVQQSDSVIHIHVSVRFQILFSFRLLQSVEQSSLCYPVGPRWLSILNIAVCTCQSQTPKLSLTPHKKGVLDVKLNCWMWEIQVCIRRFEAKFRKQNSDTFFFFNDKEIAKWPWAAVYKRELYWLPHIFPLLLDFD